MYKAVTSMVHNKPGENVASLFKELIFRRASVLSLMKDGRVWTMGWNKESRKVDMCSVGQEQAETIGRPGDSFLWIFGSM